MGDTNKQEVSSTVVDPPKDSSVCFTVHNEPVMIDALNVVSLLGKTNKAILRARGNSIPNAVAIANIVTEKMLKGNSKIQKIVVDSEDITGMGKMLSTIEIVLQKN